MKGEYKQVQLRVKSQSGFIKQRLKISPAETTMENQVNAK
jgi:hypothetical protein